MTDADGVDSAPVDRRRILVLNVDKDSDLTKKTDMSTPLMGREAVLEGARDLLIADPEEADGNALYAAVRAYDDVAADGEDEVEVVAVSGSPEGRIATDRRISDELREVFDEFPADEVVLVSDGYADEEILPIINSYAKISAVRHVVVKHSKSVEETYVVLGKYLRMLWSESPYRIYFIGVPGLLLLMTGVLASLGFTGIAWLASLIIIGAALAIHGFGIDEYVSSLRQAPSIELLKTFATVAAMVSAAVGLYLAFNNVAKLPEFSLVVENPEVFWTYAPTLTGVYVESALFPVLAAGFIYFSGILLHNLVLEKGPILRYVVFGVTMVVLFFVGNEAAILLQDPARGFASLLFYITLGFASLFLVSAITFVALRRQE